MKPNQQITPAAVDWSRARALLADLKTAARRSLVMQILVGRELACLKKQLGFTHGSQARFSPSGHNVHLGRTWSAWCQAEIGVTSRTADRWIDCFEAAIERAKRHKKAHPEALQLLQADPADTSEAFISLLSDQIHRLVDGSTQADLLSELGIVKLAAGLTGGDTSKFKKTPEELAADVWAQVFFAGIRRKLEEVRKEIFRTRDGVDYRFRLKALPLAPDPEDRERPCLQGIKLTLEEILQGDLVKVIRDVEAEIEERSKPADGITKRPRKTSTKSK